MIVEPPDGRLITVASIHNLLHPCAIATSPADVPKVIRSRPAASGPQASGRPRPTRGFCIAQPLNTLRRRASSGWPVSIISKRWGAQTPLGTTARAQCFRPGWVLKSPSWRNRW